MLSFLLGKLKRNMSVVPVVMVIMLATFWQVAAIHVKNLDPFFNRS